MRARRCEALRTTMTFIIRSRRDSGRCGWVVAAPMASSPATGVMGTVLSPTLRPPRGQSNRRRAGHGKLPITTQFIPI
jgi:hypothetical protein